jgi:dTDP-4-dehydrorhamnose reductase/dTDP-4-dehydrorhamnose 3,5-epimerase
LEFSKPLSSSPTPIPGMLVFDIPVHGDNRGWFKENWQREKMLAVGLPDLGPVQNNISFNSNRGTTRGIHAEPWDKFISVATGSVFGAWVDLRAGDSFGTVCTAVLDPSKAIYVPRGVGNSFQTLEDETVYAYLVNDHWSADAQALYTFLNLSDPSVAIEWPVPLDECDISEKDREHPFLSAVTPMKPKKTLILGSTGQLGRALQHHATEHSLPHWDFADRTLVDLADAGSLRSVAWADYDTVINAAAFTNVDRAETTEGRIHAWAANASGVAVLADVCREYSITLVHVSTDYVFDGTTTVHSEDEPLSPLGVYGQSKAAGELAVSVLPRHYIVRTSWVIGDGNNFIEVMRSLAHGGVKPSVVNDQIGRMTFTNDLAAAIAHLLTTDAEYGTYNVSNAGDPASWLTIAQTVFASAGYSPDDVTGVSTAEYFADKHGAPRPLNSVFSLDKITAAGFSPRDQWDALKQYLA